MVGSLLSIRCFVEPGAKYGGATGLEDDEFHTHFHIRMRMGYYASSLEDLPLIHNLNADDSTGRQRIDHVQITTFGAQVACAGLRSGAGS